MDQEQDVAMVEWSEMIVIFNALLKSIECVRTQLADDNLDDDSQYMLDEELNDYMMLLNRLKQRYDEIATKGDLSPDLKKRLQEVQ